MNKLRRHPQPQKQTLQRNYVEGVSCFEMVGRVALISAGILPGTGDTLDCLEDWDLLEGMVGPKGRF
jgi:hypothetical protein